MNRPSVNGRGVVPGCRRDRTRVAAADRRVVYDLLNAGVVKVCVQRHEIFRSTGEPVGHDRRTVDGFIGRAGTALASASAAGGIKSMRGAELMTHLMGRTVVGKHTCRLHRTEDVDASGLKAVIANAAECCQPLPRERTTR